MSGEPAVSLTVRALGVAVEVVVPAARADAVRSAWSRSLTAAPAVVGLRSLDHGESLLQELSTRVTLAAIEVQAGSAWMLHAAGLASRAGEVVAFVAPSGTGKSTIARTLGKRWGYVSDETVAVRPDGEVLPHPKPVSVGPPGGNKAQPSADSLGLAQAPAELRLKALVLMQRDGATPPVASPVRTAAALPRLAEQTSYLGRLPRPLTLMARVLETVDVLEVHYAEAVDLEPLVAGLLGEA